MKYFCVSDVHGFYDEMIEALNKAGFDKDNDQHFLVVCGDLFDRGRKPVECFKFVKDLILRGRGAWIRGNHEDLLQECYNQVCKTGFIGQLHHYSNGTAMTMFDVCCRDNDAYVPEDNNALLCLFESDIIYFDKIKESSKLKKILKFIDQHCVDYFEVGDHLCVHGWVPYKFKQATADEWRSARWFNGMQLWNMGDKVAGKTVVCGHWHASYGHVYFGEYKGMDEFPNRKDREAIEALFSPFVADGIVAIDACTAYSGFVNCYTFEVE